MQVYSLPFRAFLVLVLSSVLVFSGHAASAYSWAGELCPAFCRCDLFEGLRHADCSYQRLISPNVELTPTVEILDLGGNDITILDNSCFQGFDSLRSLVLANNAIHTIYLDAFSPLRNATHIDLAHNRLEYVDERIFEANRRLRTLDLAGNKFMSLQNKPLLRSASLRSLSLRDAQLTYVYGELFRALPALRSLDLSANLMITLNAAAFAVLPRLEELMLSGNRWRCDRGILKTVELLRKRGVRVELRECGDGDEGTSPGQMFERMRMGDAEPDASVEPREEGRLAHVRAEVQNIWRHLVDDDDDDEDDDEEKKEDDRRPEVRVRYGPEVERCDDSWSRLCHQYRQCLSNMSLLVLDKVSGETLTRGSYTAYDLNFVFVMGVSLGITLVTLIISCILCVRRCCEARKPRPSFAEPAHASEYTVAAPAETTPVVPLPAVTRVQRRRAPDPRGRGSAVVRRDHTPGGDSFLTRLFGRPARRHYYRSTATLVRRLSRSNLFSNRLSQHYAAESREAGFRGRGGESPGTPSNNDYFADEPFVGREAGATSEHEGERPRTETPPPAYGEVVVNMRK